MRTRGARLALVAGLILSGDARAQLHARPATAGPGHVPAAAFPRPGPQPRSPSAMTYEFVFRHFTPDDERAAGLLETEVPILRQVADDCERALAAPRFRP